MSKNDNIKNIIKNLTRDSHSWASPRAISAALLGLSNFGQEPRACLLRYTAILHRWVRT